VGNTGDWSGEFHNPVKSGAVWCGTVELGRGRTTGDSKMSTRRGESGLIEIG
jgi:hypothetical protein